MLLLLLTVADVMCISLVLLTPHNMQLIGLGFRQYGCHDVSTESCRAAVPS